MLDVHVLIHHSTPAAWVRQCCDSVADAAAHAGYPVRVHWLAGAGTHLGYNRRRGYALGDYQYVTSVDDDDWVDRDAFALLHDALAAGHPAVTTRMIRHRPDGSHDTPPLRVNLRVFQRSLAESAPLADYPLYDSWVMLAHADANGGVTELDCAPYHQRLHDSPHSRLVRAASADVTGKYAQFQNVWVARHPGVTGG